jgi:hypothetical protein
MAGFLLAWVLTDSRQFWWNTTYRDITYCCSSCCCSSWSYSNGWQGWARSMLLCRGCSVDSRSLGDRHSATGMDGLHWENSLGHKYSKNQKLQFKTMMILHNAPPDMECIFWHIQSLTQKWKSINNIVTQIQKLFHHAIRTLRCQIHVGLYSCQCGPAWHPGTCYQCSGVPLAL